MFAIFLICYAVILLWTIIYFSSYFNSAARSLAVFSSNELTGRTFLSGATLVIIWLLNALYSLAHPVQNPGQLTELLYILFGARYGARANSLDGVIAIIWDITAIVSYIVYLV